MLDKDDGYLVEFAQRFIHNNQSQVVILDLTGITKKSESIKEQISRIEQIAPNHITVSSDDSPSKAFLQRQSLMIASLASWKKLIDNKSNWLSEIPSTLIITNPPSHKLLSSRQEPKKISRAVKEVNS